MRIVRRSADEGASAVEYALIVAAIATVVVLVVVGVGTALRSSYSSSCGKIGTAMSSDTSKCK
ncbi:MAG TPA: Flp family type IVb pilin [Acidothermaceae bacterium]|nr:Flp family type IVb pilin [Acidothermaceae bacterium]